MKKRRAVLFLIVFLTACQSPESQLTEKAQIQEQPQSENGVMVTAEQEVYKTNADNIMVLIHNDSDEEFSTGVHLFLEKKVGDMWYEFPYDHDVFTAEAMIIMPGETSELSISVDELEYDLTPGEYRGTINGLAAPFRVED